MYACKIHFQSHTEYEINHLNIEKLNYSQLQIIISSFLILRSIIGVEKFRIRCVRGI